MNVISKIGTQAPSHYKEPASPVTATSAGHSKNGVVPPNLSTTVLSHPHSAGDGKDSVPNEINLRRLSLECLVFVLRSLVAWGTTAGKTVTDPTLAVGDPQQPRSRPSFDASASDPNLVDRFSTSDSLQSARASTTDLVDDPTRFESAKQMKTTMSEGIRKFNQKPKKVCIGPTNAAAVDPLFPGHRIFLGSWLHSEQISA